MMDRRPRQILWDDDAWWPDAPMSGSAHYVSGDVPAALPMLWVPDRDADGGYREHVVRVKPKARLGF